MEPGEGEIEGWIYPFLLSVLMEFIILDEFYFLVKLV